MEYKALISVLAQSLSILRPLQQLWQLGDIGRYAPGFDQLNSQAK